MRLVVSVRAQAENLRTAKCESKELGLDRDSRTADMTHVRAAWRARTWQHRPRMASLILAQDKRWRRA